MFFKIFIKIGEPIVSIPFNKIKYPRIYFIIKIPENFYKRCIEEFKLNIIGLMCIPPFDNDSNPYFIKMRKLSENLGLKDISMGMSDDYMDAIKQGSTFIRIGSKIFGSRS